MTIEHDQLNKPTGLSDIVSRRDQEAEKKRRATEMAKMTIKDQIEKLRGLDPNIYPLVEEVAQVMAVIADGKEYEPYLAETFYQERPLKGDLTNFYLYDDTESTPLTSWTTVSINMGPWTLPTLTYAPANWHTLAWKALTVCSNEANDYYAFLADSEATLILGTSPMQFETEGRNSDRRYKLTGSNLFVPTAEVAAPIIESVRTILRTGELRRPLIA